jgi:hypothetical protein
MFANVIRVLRTIIDPSLLQQIDCYFEQSIPDKASVGPLFTNHMWAKYLTYLGK